MRKYYPVIIFILTFFIGGWITQERQTMRSTPQSLLKAYLNALQTPKAVSKEEEMKSYPADGAYVAFSLKVAQKKILELGIDKNYRTEFPDVYNLGGIRRVIGIVYDRQLNDLILIGRYYADQQPLTLDDFVVALRAQLIHNTWPLVSIDPVEDDRSKDINNDQNIGFSGAQIVRFEGGIENTQFGADLLDADYRLKLISFGILNPGIPGFKSLREITRRERKISANNIYKLMKQIGDIGCRFWFYPTLSAIIIKGDVGILGEDLKVKVFSEREVFSQKRETKICYDENLEEKYKEFTEEMNKHLDRLALVHPSFSRVQGLAGLVAISKVLSELKITTDLSFWLQNYKAKIISSPSTLKLVNRVESQDITGGLRFLAYFANHPLAYFNSVSRLYGGVLLSAISIRLVSVNDPETLKKTVISTRPKPEALSWTFLLDKQELAIDDSSPDRSDVIKLFKEAESLQLKNSFDDAIALYGSIINLKPEKELLSEVYKMRGLLYSENKKDYAKAIDDFNKALEIDSKSAIAYMLRGTAYNELNNYPKAIADFTKSIELDTQSAKTFMLRGIAYNAQKDYDKSIADFTKSLELDPQSSITYRLRAAVYAQQNNYTKALEDYDQAIEISPKYIFPYFFKAEICEKMGNNTEAVILYLTFLRVASMTNSSQDKQYRESAKNKLEKLITAYPISELKPPQDKSLIYVIRHSQLLGSKNTRLIELDGNVVAVLENKSFFCDIVDPGPHKLHVVSSPFTQEQRIKMFDAKPNEAYFFTISSRKEKKSNTEKSMIGLIILQDVLRMLGGAPSAGSGIGSVIGNLLGEKIGKDWLDIYIKGLSIEIKEIGNGEAKKLIKQLEISTNTNWY